MKDKYCVVSYPHEIKFIDKNGGAISYYVDRKVSDYVKELQDKLSKAESENRQKDIDNLQLQSNWNSLREDLKRYDLTYLHETGEHQLVYVIEAILDKMNELEGEIE